MTRPILLDTNVLIWALNDDRALTRRMRAAITSPTAQVHVSVVSAWEIAIKYQCGKLSFDVPVEEVLSRILGWHGLAGLARAAGAHHGAAGASHASPRPF